MNVIVSTVLEDKFSRFVVVKSFEDVKKIEGVQVLVIHQYEESDFDVGIHISELYKSGIQKFIYISKKPSTSLKLILEGVHGSIFDDEFYFDDEDELIYLLEDLDSDNGGTGTELATTNVDIVRGFMQSFARKEDRVNTPLYLEQVNTAIDELAKLTEVQGIQISSMGKTALDIFEKANGIISNLDRQRKVLEEQFSELRKEPVQSRPMLGGGVQFFPTYKYVGIAKVLLIREVSPCRYLTSMLLAYEHYLHYALNKRVKLIFVHGKGAGIAKKYEGFTSISQESMKMASLYDSEVIATNNPKADVLKKLFAKQCDIFIVVDRLYGSQDIVSGRVSKLNAVGGISDLARYKLQKNNCIFPVDNQDGAFCSIPTISKFPTGTDVRFAAYTQVCKETFEKLDNFLQLPKE